MIDEVIRRITVPETAVTTATRLDARDRLLAAARAETVMRSRRRAPLGRRGLAVVALLVALPGGVALANELSGGDGSSLTNASDCPELLAGIEQRGLSSDAVLVAGCPSGADVDRTLDLLSQLQQRREKLAPGEHDVIGVGGSGEGSWGLGGIAGQDGAEAGP